MVKYRANTEGDSKTLKTKALESYIFLTQGMGLAFFVIFVAAYFGGLPSSGNLIGDPTFRTVLSVFGGLFLLLMVGVFLAAALVNRKK
jgi:hypothetical protein